MPSIFESIGGFFSPNVEKSHDEYMQEEYLQTITEAQAKIAKMKNSSEFGSDMENITDTQTVQNNYLLTNYNSGGVTLDSSLNEIIANYRKVAQISFVADAIDEIINTAIVQSDIPKNPVSIDFNDPQKKLDEKLRQSISNEFNTVLDIMNFDNLADEWFKSWYVDGRFVLQIIFDKDNKKEGVQKVKPMSPINLRRFYDEKLKKFFYVYDPTANQLVNQTSNRETNTDIQQIMDYQYYSNKKLDIIPDEQVVFVPSGLYDYNKRTSISYLHFALRDINRLDTLEDHFLIYRIVRSPERRVFYIDPGQVPPKKAQEYLQHVINTYKQKKVYDESTGTLYARTKHPSILEDFFLLRYGDKGTQIDTLSSAGSMDEINDLVYFNKKAMRSLHVPFSRVNAEDRQTIGYQPTVTDVTREELKFSKFIWKLRNKFNEMFYEVLYRQLVWKNIIKEEEWESIRRKVCFRYTDDMAFAEEKRLQNYTAKLELLNSIKDFVGDWFSRKLVYSEILGWSDETVREVQKRIKEEEHLDNSEKPEAGAEGGAGGEEAAPTEGEGT